jgi:hypothetical protein
VSDRSDLNDKVFSDRITLTQRLLFQEILSEFWKKVRGLRTLVAFVYESQNCQIVIIL